jgi:hypothetical protein
MVRSRHRPPSRYQLQFAVRQSTRRAFSLRRFALEHRAPPTKFNYEKEVYLML